MPKIDILNTELPELPKSNTTIPKSNTTNSMSIYDLIPKQSSNKKEQVGVTLNKDIVENAYKDGVKLLITVDNGISAHEATSHAKSLGMTMIVTDHHELPITLPEADAIINPHQSDCAYPYKTLAGVGIAYKLGQALMSYFKAKPTPNLIGRIQALVALGTVCDVAPLIGENRHMVKSGLIALNKGAIPAASTISSKISVGTLGFQIGPRLNACGRLENADALNQDRNVENVEKTSRHSFMPSACWFYPVENRTEGNNGFHGTGK